MTRTTGRDDPATDEQESDDLTIDGSTIEALTDPAALRDDPAIRFTEETNVHEDRDHCNAGIAGKVVVGVTDEDGRHLLLVNDDLGVALLPYGDIEAGEDWAAVACREAEGQTGIAVDLEAIAVVREVEHLVEGEAEPYATTHRVVFHASPADGEIQDCKQSADAGSDDWRAGWFADLPEGIEFPPAGPGDDLELVLG